MSDNINNDYEIITEHILSSEGQCVLVLGPELSVGSDGRAYKPYFKEIVRKDNQDNNNIVNQDVIRYFDSENLFYFNDKSAERRIKIKVKEFYSTVGDPVLLELISRIKFPLIINVCPDITLNNAYLKKGVKFSSGYFSKNQTPNEKNLPKPTKGLPVIYNIFGSIENDASLILTHEKLYETIAALLQEKAIDDNIQSFINAASSFIFLGFKFDSWYYQLLCHKLGINRYGESITSLSAPDCEDNDTVKILMKNSFAMDFTDENPAQVIQRLIEGCYKKKPDSLRPKEANSVYSLYISYARKEDIPGSTSNMYDREAIVDLIEVQLKVKGQGLIQIFKDRNELTYGDSIDSFMNRIGKGKAVIRVISDKYLKSRYCMDEALRIDKYRDNDKRIFTVFLNDFATNEILDVTFKKYWKEKCESFINEIDIKEKDIISRECLKRNYFVYIDIYNFVDSFIKQVEDEINFRIDPSDLIVNGDGESELSAIKFSEFNKFIETIINKMKED
jgi:hypothetical protein